MAKITERSEATKADYRRSLKQFYRWLEDIDERLLSNDFMIRETTKKLYNLPVDVGCKRMGWVIGSEQLRNYTHISEINLKTEGNKKTME